MEMRRIDILKVNRLTTFLHAFFILLGSTACAQSHVKSYSIKNGKMYIAISKDLQKSSLDSFIVKYDLADLDLQYFIKTGSVDSLNKLGWKVDINNKEMLIISKAMQSFSNINNPADKIIFTQNEKQISAPASVYNQERIGYNRFRNKLSFDVSDSVVRFFLRGNIKAKNVFLAGDFNNWSPNTQRMIKTDSGWIANVKLNSGKHLYKYIVDGYWTIDKENFNKENDGIGNDNSVYYKTNYNFTLNGFTDAKKVYLSGSFNDWNENEMTMQRTATGWTIPVYLTEGTHTYRFIADGKWFSDPANNDKLPNEFNEYNSVIRIGNPYMFRLDGFTTAKKVVITGSFNGWKDNELFMNKTATGWELSYTLGPGNYEYKYKIDDREPGDPVNHGIIPLIVEPNYTFRLKGFADANTVYISGDINNWNPLSFRMTKEGDDWIFNAYLSKGKHSYKFVVDGKWVLDPSNKLWEQNEYETGNSVLWIDMAQ